MGIVNLIDKIYAILDENKKDKNNEFILNISGGYKAFIPILTIMGQLNNIPISYIYKESEKPITIAHFPLQFDWGAAEQYYLHLDNRLLKDNDYISKNEAVVEELKKNLLITKDKPYQLTGLGELLKEHVNSNMPDAKEVTGHIAEYKMFEYFLNFPYQENYTKVKRSVKVGSVKVGKGEIDLELSSPGGEVVICEVKIFSQVYGNANVEEIKKHASKRIGIYRENEKNLKGYIIIIHKGRFDNIKYISENLKQIKEEVIAEKVDCKIFYIERPSNYQKFVSKPLEKDDLKEIKEI